MNMNRVRMLGLFALAAMTLSVGVAQAQGPSSEREAPPLRLVQEIPLPGVEGRLDHFTIDANHYESMAHVATGPTARTSLFVPELKRLFVAVPVAPDRAAEILVFEVQP